MSAGARIR